MATTKAQIGVIGLAVMGANLARNFASKEIRTIVFNRTAEKTHSFIREYGTKILTAEMSLKAFVAKLESPRKIVLMVKAGEAVDEILKSLRPLLERGDIIIDCGNSYYKDTECRLLELKKHGLPFIGCGVSGGEEGALHGPSLMPGGDKKTWQHLEPFFEAIAAKDFQNKPCVAYIGSGASGHFVKMVHNGIEYGVMQLMAEIYDLLRTSYQLSLPTIGKIFAKLQQGKLNSYLFEIAVKIFQRKDPDHPKKYLIDAILDHAAQKGTGAWVAQEALDNQVALPTLTEAVLARFLSSDRVRRVSLQAFYPQTLLKKELTLPRLVKMLEPAFYSALLSTYAQGYDLIQKVSKQQGWGIDLAEVARIWQGGCIIRAKILDFIYKAYQKKSQKHLFELAEVRKGMKDLIPALRELVAVAAKGGIPFSAFASTLFYFESMTQARGPANFIQALRDYFGAHSYERIDREGIFHTDWNR